MYVWSSAQEERGDWRTQNATKPCVSLAVAIAQMAEIQRVAQRVHGSSLSAGSDVFFTYAVTNHYTGKSHVLGAIVQILASHCESHFPKKSLCVLFAIL